MREIKFRGLHTHAMSCNEHLNGTQAYGFLCGNGNYIESEDEVEKLIDRNTIGQYTGLKDKNGKEIYEGDILDVITINDNFADEFLIDINTKFIVDYNNDSFAPSLISETCKNIYHTFDEIDSNDVEVIGNIYENPELLEGGNND